jgi:hypothetical protein
LDGADGKGATGIGSVNNIVTPMLLARASYSTHNVTEDFGWYAGTGSDFANGTYPLYLLSNSSTIVGEACQPLPATTPDLSRSMVLVRRGGCGFEVKVRNIAAAGGHNVLFYNNGPSVDSFTVNIEGINEVGIVPRLTGEEFIRLMAANVSITLNVTNKASSPVLYQIEQNPTNGGFASAFTQWGPSNELAVVTTFTAPGGYMLSTYTVQKGSYNSQSGASMATPYLEGCMALMMERLGKIPPAEVNARLAATANPNVFHDGVTANPWMGSVTQQGAGLINVYDAIYATTVINVTSLSFNDTNHMPESVAFRIENKGEDSVVYTLGHVGSGTVYALPAGGSSIPSTFTAGSIPETVTEYATLSFNPALAVADAGESIDIEVSASIPEGLDAARIPIYSGYVTLNGTNGDSFSIPYLGAATAMRDVVVLDSSLPGQNHLSDRRGGPAVEAGHQFYLPNPDGTSTGTVRYPLFHRRLSMGTRILRIDVKPVEASEDTTNVLGEDILGSVPGYPMYFLPRNPAIPPRPVQWNGNLAGGGYVPTGSYTLLVQALRIFGDPENPEDWDVVETPQFSIAYGGSG